MPEIVSMEEIGERIKKTQGGEVAAKPEVKPEVNPEAKPEAKPEVKSEEKIDLDTFNKKFGTTIENEDQLKERLSAFDKYKELDPKYSDLEKRYNDLAKIDPFANEIVKGFNDLVANNADPQSLQAYVRLNTIDTEKLDPSDKFILTYQLRDGLNEKEAQISFQDEYKTDKSQYEFDPYEPDEVENVEKQIEKEKIRLKRDSKGIDSFLSDYKKEVSKVEKPDDLSKKWKEYEPNVKQLSPKVAEKYEGLKAVPLTVADGNNEAITFDFQVPDDFREKIPQLVESFLAGKFATGDPLTLNEDGLKQIKNHLDLTLKAHWFDKYLVDSNMHTSSTIREQMANKYSNSNPVERGNKIPQKVADALTEFKKKQLEGQPKVFS